MILSEISSCGAEAHRACQPAPAAASRSRHRTRPAGPRASSARRCAAPPADHHHRIQNTFRPAICTLELCIDDLEYALTTSRRGACSRYVQSTPGLPAAVQLPRWARLRPLPGCSVSWPSARTAACPVHSWPARPAPRRIACINQHENQPLKLTARSNVVGCAHRVHPVDVSGAC